MGRRSAHDSMRQRVYDSETAAANVFRGKTYKSHKQVEARALAILDRAYIKRHYGSPVVDVRVRRSDAKACCEYKPFGYTLAFPGPNDYGYAWAWSDWVICHEVSHALAAHKHGRRIAGHGREFVIVLLDVVRHVMGREAHDALKAALRKRNVKTSKPRAAKPKPAVDPAELAERLARGRATAAANRAKTLAGPVTIRGGVGRWSYGETPDGRWVVIGPDGTRYLARKANTARERIEREANAENETGVACLKCARPFEKTYLRGDCGAHQWRGSHEDNHESWTRRITEAEESAARWRATVVAGETPPPLPLVTRKPPLTGPSTAAFIAWLEENGCPTDGLVDRTPVAG